MRLSKRTDDGEVVQLRCEGEISQLPFGGHGNPLEDVLGPDGFRRKVLLDLEQASFIDSSDVSWLLTCHKRLTEAGGKLVLHSIPPRIDQVLQLLRMPLVLHMAKNETAARELLSGGKG